MKKLFSLTTLVVLTLLTSCGKGDPSDSGSSAKLTLLNPIGATIKAYSDSGLTTELTKLSNIKQGQTIYVAVCPDNSNAGWRDVGYSVVWNVDGQEQESLLALKLVMDADKTLSTVSFDKALAVSSVDDLNRISSTIEGKNVLSGKTFVVINDITTDKTFQGIRGNGYAGGFAGIFDGLGHTITLAINKSDDLGALFQAMDGGTIKNLKVAGKVTAQGYVGAIAGVAKNATIVDCENLADVTGTMNQANSRCLAGGLVGVISGGKIENCINSGKVTANETQEVGGIAGRAANADILGCVNYGPVTIGDQMAGGIVGCCLEETAVNISKCANFGVVSGVEGGGYLIGGIVGQTSGKTKVYDCYHAGISRAYDSRWQVGGIVGANVKGDIKRCYSTGTASSGSPVQVGHIAGLNSNWQGTSPGTISGTYYLRTNPDLIGIGTLNNPTSDNPQQTKELSAQNFGNQASFVGWDFANVWEMKSGLTGGAAARPVLRVKHQEK